MKTKAIKTSIGNTRKTFKVTRDLILVGLGCGEDAVFTDGACTTESDTFLGSDKVQTKGITVDDLMKDPRVKKRLRTYVATVLGYVKEMEILGECARHNEERDA